jgi:hypothetical protein
VVSAAPGGDEPTAVVSAASGGDEPATADETTRDVAATEDTTGSVLGTRAASDGAVTNGVTRDEGTDSGERTQVLRLPTTDGDTAESGERTQVLRLPVAADGNTAESGERTQVIRVGTVDPPAERTQLLTIPTAGEATVASPAGERMEETTKAMSIAGTERPDPGADPTTPLNVPGEATSDPSRDRGAMTVTNLERPADETADDTAHRTP